MYDKLSLKRGWDISNSANDKPERLRVSHFQSFRFFVDCENNVGNRVEWSVGHSTPAGKRGKTEIPQRSEKLRFLPAESEWP
ncbi:hypothetical protein [Priestia flexa]|uniref:hypothetical protein n=1 Tax=Priestia flexa TaxID=86664 RepID=UPI000473504E|nr:hypothetical protein [Priestia flexa]